MNIDSDKIEAFAVLSRHLNYSKAAMELHLSQPALSKKIAKLEDELGTSLLIRSKRKVELTESGLELVNYWYSKQELDRELVSRIGTSNETFSGTIRVAGFSTITSSRILPGIAGLLKSFPELKLELYSRELEELPAFLLNGKVDFVFTKEALSRENVVSELIGTERLIHVLPLRATKDLPFLDHDVRDRETFDFLRAQGMNLSVRRSFVDDIHSIMSGVACGIGQAIISHHLFDRSTMRKVTHKKEVSSPIFLNYMRRNFVPKLHRDVAEAFRRNF